MNKHLLKSLFLSMLMILGATGAWALTADLSMNYELVGYKAKAFYDFTGNADGVLPTEGDLRYRGGYGLYNFGSGGRSGNAAISVAAGDVLVCQFADTQNRGVTINSIEGCTRSSTLNDGSHHFFVADDDVASLTFNLGRAGCIVSLLVMEVDNNVATADYTLNYVLGGETVKTVSATGAVGGTVLTDASFFANDVKYFRAGGEPESFTIADEGNTFTVKVRLAENYYFTLTDNFGATIISGTGLEGEKAYAPYPRYLLAGSKFYEADKTNSEYRKTLTLDADNTTATVTYTEKDGVNAVFFAEGENIDGMTLSTAGNIPVRASNAKAGVTSEDVVITTLPAGKYVLHVGVFTSKSSEQKIQIGYGETSLDFASSGNLNESASAEIELNAETEIKYFGTTSSADAQFDYIWIEKTGEYEAPVDPLATEKEALQTAIAIATNINPEGLADAIAAAQAALTAEGATAESMAQAAQTLEAAIKTYFGEVLPNLGAIVTALNEETLNTAYADAQAALAKEDVTPQKLAAAMQQIITAAQAVAPEHLQNLKGYAVKYGATDAATLVDNALAAIEAGNVAQIIATMTAVKEAATPLAQTVLGTMKNYVEAFGLTEQAAQAQAALEGGNYITMITTAKALFTHLIAAAKEYLPKLGDIATGLNDETLNTAYAAAQELLAKESITPEELGAAMRNIITAAQAVAPAHLQNLREYAVKYGAEGTATLVDNALAAIEAGNVSQIIATMTAVKEAATPLATSILTQMIEEAKNYEGLAEDVTAAQAVLAGGNYISMIITAKALYAKLTAISTGISTVKAATDKDVWYDMNGRKLQGKPTVKGMYLKNGRKVIVK